MAKFYISAVEHSDHPHRHISAVCLHDVNEQNVFRTGRRVSKDHVVGLLNSGGNTVSTIRWDYTNVNWKVGASVAIETIGRIHYIRSAPDVLVVDNLSNLPTLNAWM